MYGLTQFITPLATPSNSRGGNDHILLLLVPHNQGAVRLFNASVIKARVQQCEF